MEYEKVLRQSLNRIVEEVVEKRALWFLSTIRFKCVDLDFDLRRQELINNSFYNRFNNGRI